MACFWGHKWSTVFKNKGRISREEGDWNAMIGEVQVCSKCGKERGLIHTLDGDVTEIDAEFIKNPHETYEPEV